MTQKNFNPVQYIKKIQLLNQYADFMLLKKDYRHPLVFLARALRNYNGISVIKAEDFNQDAIIEITNLIHYLIIIGEVDFEIVKAFNICIPEMTDREITELKKYIDEIKC